MKIILTSLLKTHTENEDGSVTVIPLQNINQLLTNIKNNLSGRKKFVFVANDPEIFEDNDNKTKIVVESLQLAGICFNEFLVLDARNKNNAFQILDGADLIVLRGGKCLCQYLFLKEINFSKIVKENENALIVGISAGSMNLGDVVANFPEEIADLNQPKWLEGMGLCREVVIPHFDGKRKKYQFPCEEIDLVNDYILPMSKGRKFFGLDNEAYLLIDGDQRKLFGNVCEISNGKVKKLET